MANRMVRRSTSVPLASEMFPLRDMMGRLMENAFINPDQWGMDFGMRLPSIDVSENNDGYVVRAELPGWKPEDIDISVEGNTLTIRGQLNEDVDQGGDPNTRYHHREIRRGSFERSISLPADVQADRANAEFDNGVLTLTLPKSEAAKPKQIKIAGSKSTSSTTSSTKSNAPRQ
jgi:HSP20 family protein